MPEACSAVQLIRSFLAQEEGNTEGEALRARLMETCSSLSLLDLNYALYRCDSEEKDDGMGGGAYVVPGAGALVYCGIHGIMTMLQTVRNHNDLGHPICDNLRAGDWMAGYTVNRLKLRAGTEQVGVCVSRCVCVCCIQDFAECLQHYPMSELSTLYEGFRAQKILFKRGV